MDDSGKDGLATTIRNGDETRAASAADAPAGDAALRPAAQLKKEARARMRRERDAMPEARRRETDAALMRRLLSLPEFETAADVFAYLSFGSEVETRAIIEAAWGVGKRVFLPRCEEDGMLVWGRAESFGDLETNRFGIAEPREGTVYARIVSADTAVALVPGLAFDRHGYRLGYGGGYYDRFLAEFRGRTVGLCREAALRSDLHDEGLAEFHDLPVGAVLTEAAAYRHDFPR